MAILTLSVPSHQMLSHKEIDMNGYTNITRIKSPDVSHKEIDMNGNINITKTMSPDTFKQRN